MLRAEVYVKRDQLFNQRVRALPQISYRIESILKISPGGVQRYADRPSPPLQQWHQIIHERVVRVSRVSDTLRTPELLLGLHVVVQHPVVASLLGVRHHRSVHALGHLLHPLEHGGRPFRGGHPSNRVGAAEVLREGVQLIGYFHRGHLLGIEGGQVPAGLLQLPDDVGGRLVRADVDDQVDHEEAEDAFSDEDAAVSVHLLGLVGFRGELVLVYFMAVSGGLFAVSLSAWRSNCQMVAEEPQHYRPS